MVANPRPLNMTANSRPNFPDFQNAKYICSIVGLVCLTGFVLGMLTISLPLGDFSLRWRVDFLHELGDRSITLILGASLLMWGLSGGSRVETEQQGEPQRKKRPFLSAFGRQLFSPAQQSPALRQRQRYQRFRMLSLFSLLVGIAITFLSILVIHDTVELNKQAISKIDDQAATKNAQITIAKNDPQAFGETLAPEVIDQAYKDVKDISLKENAKTRIIKSGVETFIYLLIVGFGLIALGRWGLA
jgi:hypothetical protein